jgi:predicted HTH domain antitoxin
VVSQKQHINKSEAAKELLHRGFILYELDEYKQGKISIGKLAENLTISILEALDLVAKYGVYQNIPKDYLVEASQRAAGLFKSAPSKK